MLRHDYRSLRFEKVMTTGGDTHNTRIETKNTRLISSQHISPNKTFGIGWSFPPRRLEYPPPLALVPLHAAAVRLRNSR